jgi:aspartyl-tRNA(Asn)/glutamyl-tRNA(Gln) amidotransferase subunit B
VDEIRLALPELPHSRRERFKKEYGLSEYDAEILTGQIDMAEYFEAAVKLYPNAKMIANWLMGDIMAHLNAKGLDIASVAMKPDGLAGLLKMIDDKTISGKMAKEVLFEAVDTGFTPADIVKKKGLSQITDVSKIEEATRAVIERETKSVNDYKAGKAAAFTFLVGQVMRQTHGKANPAAVNEVLKRLLAG